MDCLFVMMLFKCTVVDILVQSVIHQLDEGDAVLIG